jgi:hypothetical protein
MKMEKMSVVGQWVLATSLQGWRERRCGEAQGVHCVLKGMNSNALALHGHVAGLTVCTHTSATCCGCRQLNEHGRSTGRPDKCKRHFPR